MSKRWTLTIKIGYQRVSFSFLDGYAAVKLVEQLKESLEDSEANVSFTLRFREVEDDNQDEQTV